MPGYPFPGDPDRYPTKDEAADYLAGYAEHLGVDVRTLARVQAVEQDRDGFVVQLQDESLSADGVIAASGTFGSPHTPRLPGDESFTGRSLHVADYRSPQAHAGERVIVVGGGNSAVQVAHELAAVASVTLATLEPVVFLPQRSSERDLHHWLETTGFDHLPAAWLQQLVNRPLVLDTGDYARALDSGVIGQRRMFSAFDGDAVVWPDGATERADTVIFATGYRPSLNYLRPLGALTETGQPRHVAGISTTHLGLVYLGLEFQRSFSSNTLRGVSRDADYVVRVLASYLNGGHRAIGL
jgi:putative flavoprotein involved in K+ transport